MKTTRSGLASVFVFTLVACSPDAVDLEDAKTMSPQGEIGDLNDSSLEVAELAARVLADELDIPLADIAVDTVRAVEWRDSSIGCPQPGEAYLQVITPGHKITLQVGDTLHTVHEANGRAFVCKTRKAPERVTGQIDLVWGQQAFAARKDLAGRLGVDEDTIMISGVQETPFSDSSLACPEPGVNYEQGDRKGFVLTLRHGSRNYTYHTDLKRTVPCPAISED